MAGCHELALTPARLLVATAPTVLSDSEIERFVRRDIRMIVTRWHELEPALAAAYKSAALDARRLIEAAVAEANPEFLKTMRGWRP